MYLCLLSDSDSAPVCLASRLEWTVSQWGVYLESAAQLRCWMEAVEREVCAPLTPQPGPREKASQLEKLRALLADLEDHQVALSSLEEKARELFKKTGDVSFNHGARIHLQGQFDDLTASVEVGGVVVFFFSQSSGCEGNIVTNSVTASFPYASL